MGFRYSATLENLFEELGPEGTSMVCDEVGMFGKEWSSCTSGYDNDGSTGLDIFENGVQFGISCGNKPIVAAQVDGVCYFFNIPESKVVEIANAIAEEDLD